MALEAAASLVQLGLCSKQQHALARAAALCMLVLQLPKQRVLPQIATELRITFLQAALHLCCLAKSAHAAERAVRDAAHDSPWSAFRRGALTEFSFGSDVLAAARVLAHRRVPAPVADDGAVTFFSSCVRCVPQLLEPLAPLSHWTPAAAKKWLSQLGRNVQPGRSATARSEASELPVDACVILGLDLLTRAVCRHSVGVTLAGWVLAELPVTVQAKLAKIQLSSSPLLPVPSKANSPATLLVGGRYDCKSKARPYLCRAGSMPETPPSPSTGLARSCSDPALAAKCSTWGSICAVPAAGASPQVRTCAARSYASVAQTSSPPARSPAAAAATALESALHKVADLSTPQSALQEVYAAWDAAAVRAATEPITFDATFARAKATLQGSIQQLTTPAARDHVTLVAQALYEWSAAAAARLVMLAARQRADSPPPARSPSNSAAEARLCAMAAQPVAMRAGTPSLHDTPRHAPEQPPASPVLPGRRRRSLALSDSSTLGSLSTTPGSSRPPTPLLSFSFAPLTLPPQHATPPNKPLLPPRSSQSIPSLSLSGPSVIPAAPLYEISAHAIRGVAQRASAVRRMCELVLSLLAAKDDEYL